MAYMNQEKKKVIAAMLKGVVPKTWKYTLSVRHYSTIVMRVKSAPIDLVKTFGSDNPDHCSINHYYTDRAVVDGNKQLVETLEKIVKVLNNDNYDNSDIMTDYFDVGHYVDLQFGSWEKPYTNTLKETA